MAGPPSRRRQFFIKKEFQGKFILLYALSIAAMAGIIGLGVYVFIRRSIEKHLYSSHLKIERTGDLLFDILMQTNIMAVFVIVVLVIFLSIIVFGRLNLHFYRMEQRLDAMAEGDFSMHSQPKTRFNEIATLIAMIDETRQVCQQRRARLDEALELLNQGCGEEGDLRRIEEAKEILDAQLAGVRLPSPSAQS